MTDVFARNGMGYTGLVAEPKLLGGDLLDLRSIQLQTKHLEQKDKSLNVKLWSHLRVEVHYDFEIFPNDSTHNLKGCSTLVRQWCLTLRPPYDFTRIASRAKVQERQRMYDLVDNFMLGYVGLVGMAASGTVILQLCQRKGQVKVDPLDVVVKRVSEGKNRINSWYQSGKFDAACVGYLQLIFDMWPWCSSPLLLTAKQCFDSGLAELEAALWNNLAISLLKSSLADPELRSVLSMNAALQVIDMRYAPSNLRYKSHGRFLEALKYRQRRGLDVPTSMDIAILEESIAEMKDKDSKDWAHRHCITEHVCYSDRMLARIRAAGKKA